MDEIVVAQTKYISSKRAARLTGYAQDYIGQLVRMNKVNATKVGKAWFVEEAGLMQHVNGSNRLPAPIKQLAEVEVRAHGQYVSRVKAGISYPASWGAISYLQDDSPLMPDSISDKRDSAEIKGIDAHDSARTGGSEDDFQVHIRRGSATQRYVSASSVDGVRFSVPERPDFSVPVRSLDESFVGVGVPVQHPLGLGGETKPSIRASMPRLFVAASLVALCVFFVPLVG